MLSCEKVLLGLWEYLDKEMGPEDMAHMQQHLDLCRSCFTRIEFEIRFREEIRSKTNHVCPEQLKNRIKKLIDLF